MIKAIVLFFFAYFFLSSVEALPSERGTSGAAVVPLVRRTEGASTAVPSGNSRQSDSSAASVPSVVAERQTTQESWTVGGHAYNLILRKFKQGHGRSTYLVTNWKGIKGDEPASRAVLKKEIQAKELQGLEDRRSLILYDQSKKWVLQKYTKGTYFHLTLTWMEKRAALDKAENAWKAAKGSKDEGPKLKILQALQQQTKDFLLGMQELVHKGIDADRKASGSRNRDAFGLTNQAWTESSPGNLQVTFIDMEYTDEAATSKELGMMGNITPDPEKLCASRKNYDAYIAEEMKQASSTPPPSAGVQPVTALATGRAGSWVGGTTGAEPPATPTSYSSARASQAGSSLKAPSTPSAQARSSRSGASSSPEDSPPKTALDGGKVPGSPSRARSTDSAGQLSLENRVPTAIASLPQGSTSVKGAMSQQGVVSGTASSPKVKQPSSTPVMVPVPPPSPPSSDSGSSSCCIGNICGICSSRRNQ